MNLQITKIAYKLLNLLEFQSNGDDDDDGMRRLLTLCFDTLIYIHGTLNASSDPKPDLIESIQNGILLMRICSNIVALNQKLGDFVITNWFQFQSRSMALFFNYFDELFKANGFSVAEIHWFIGNLLECPMNESTAKYLECEEFFKNC